MSRKRSLSRGLAMLFAGSSVLGAGLRTARAEEPAASDKPVDSAPAVSAPQVLTKRDAEYPQAALARQLAGTVVLRVTVGVDGAVVAAEAQEGAEPLLVDAALAAVRLWTFAPAVRGGVPIASRILVPFAFTPPRVDDSLPATDAVAAEVPSAVAPGAAPGAVGATQPQVTPTAVPLPVISPPLAPAVVAPAVGTATTTVETGAPSTASAEVLVKGKRDPQTLVRSASDYHVHRDVLAAAPRSEGAEVLRTAPGLYLARPEGGAVAHRYVLRGFDSDHGQDIEFKVNDVPINLPAHIHGQGYADLGFLIAETVDQLHVTEGVHDPRQGDFAVAGSINVDLAVPQRGVLLKGGYGSFGTARALGIWAPADQLPDSFAAAQFEKTNGFGSNRNGGAANAVVQQGFSGEHTRYSALGIFHVARAQMPGVLRKDDVDSGQVDFYGVYPEPTAEAQSAFNQRAIVGLRGNYTGEEGDIGALGLWLSADHFLLRENLTGFLQQSQTLAGVAGRGDLIEQRNSTQSIGMYARYRRAPERLFSSVEWTLELGANARLDQIAQSQTLIDGAVRAQIWDRRVDAELTGLDLAGYGDLDVHIMERVRLRAGLRATALGYAVEDKLGNFAPLSRAQDQYLVGYRRSAYGALLGPRLSADVDVLSGLTLHAAYGHGYRSPQARLLEDGEEAPFTRVRSLDAGLRYAPMETVQASLSAYQTDLSDDVAFEAEEGRLERVGRTRRRGAALELQLRPWPGIVASTSCTYVNAELLEPPAPTPENPNPPFTRGQNLPFVPPIVLRADVGATRELLPNTTGRVGVGFSALSPRPLPYGDTSEAVALLDGSLGVTWRMLGASLEVFNVLDTRYSALELTYPSQWDTDGPRSRLPARHQIAGSPRSLMFTLEVRL